MRGTLIPANFTLAEPKVFHSPSAGEAIEAQGFLPGKLSSLLSFGALAMLLCQ